MTTGKTAVGPTFTRAPLALAAIAFAGGIWLEGHVQRPPMMWAGAAALLASCAVAAVFAKSLRLAQFSALLALLGAGAFAHAGALAPNLEIPPAEFLNGAAVEIEGHVTSDGAFLPGGRPRERFDFEAESMRLGERQIASPVGMRVNVFSSHWDEEPGDEAGFPRLAYGDRVRMIAKLRLPRNFRNPGAFDYESYLRGLGISTLASLPADKIEVLPGKVGNRLGFWRSRIRRSILEHIGDEKTGLWSHDDAALFAAMIAGDDSMLIRNVREEFQETGVYHLLVVSGMNVALLALAVFWLARRLGAPEWAAALVTIALSIFYAYIAGMGVPIQRAVLMLSVYLGARLLYRERAALNATGLAALVVLAWAPKTLFEPGFQLTFLALLAISGISLPILERTSEPYRRALKNLDSTTYDLTLEPRLAQLRLDLRLVEERLQAIFGAWLGRWLVAGAAKVCLALYELAVVSCITASGAGPADAGLLSPRGYHRPAGKHPGAAAGRCDAERRNRGDRSQLHLSSPGPGGGMDCRWGVALDAGLPGLAFSFAHLAVARARSGLDHIVHRRGRHYCGFACGAPKPGCGVGGSCLAPGDGRRRRVLS